MTTAQAVANSSSQSTSNTISSAQSSLNADYTQFLSYLTTELQNQDPTSPVDTTALTQQEMQMTGVQQQLLSNQLLQQLVSQSSGGQAVANSVNLLGKSVTANTSGAVLTNGTASWNYNLPSQAANGTATITNSSGQVVFSGPLSNLNSGTDQYVWNGVNNTGQQSQNGGTYNLSISATDSNGNPIAATTQTGGKVTGIQQDSNGNSIVQLNNNITVPISTINSVM